MSATPHDTEAGSIALAQAPLLVVPLRFAIWERAAGRDFAPTAASLSALFLPAPVPGALAYTGYNFIAGKLGPARACMLLYMAPVDAAVPAWIVLGERLGWFHIAGAALVISGIYAAPRFAVKPPVPAK